MLERYITRGRGPQQQHLIVGPLVDRPARLVRREQSLGEAADQVARRRRVRLALAQEQAVLVRVRLEVGLDLRGLQRSGVVERDVARPALVADALELAPTRKKMKKPS